MENLPPALRARVLRLNADLTLEELDPEPVVWLACDLLVAGADTPALCELAGESPTGLTRADAEPLVRRMLTELGVEPVDTARAPRIVAHDIARRMISGSLAPEDGANELWSLWTYRDDVAGISALLGPLERWEDTPAEHRDEDALRAELLDVAEQVVRTVGCWPDSASGDGPLPSPGTGSATHEVSSIYQQQWPGGYGPPPPAYPPQGPPPGPPQGPPPSTRPLTAAKWTTFGIALLLLPLMGLWVRHGYDVLEDLRKLSALADTDSGDGKGLKGGDEAIAWWEFLVIVEWATLVAVVLLAIVAFVAGTGKAWARGVCTFLLLFPIGVIIFGVIDSGPDGLWGAAFLVPFGVLFALWWRPATTRAMRVKARKNPWPHHQQPMYYGR